MYFYKSCFAFSAYSITFSMLPGVPVRYWRPDKFCITGNVCLLNLSRDSYSTS